MKFAQSLGHILKTPNKVDHRARLFTLNPKFMFWPTYISMVEIVLYLIRAEMDGIWIVHLDAFTSMMSSFTGYKTHTLYGGGHVYRIDLEKTKSVVHAEFIEGTVIVKKTKRGFNQILVDQATNIINMTYTIHKGIIAITLNNKPRTRFV